MKRIIFCFDGTWNKLAAEHPTNVVLAAQSIVPSVSNEKGDITQIVHYDQGVGTNDGESIRGGAFGKGLLENLFEAYKFLIFNYEIGDEIFVLGFSRGAYSARSFVGLLRNCGLLQRANASHIAECISFYKSRLKEHHPNSEFMNKFRYQYAQPMCVSAQEDA